MIHIVELPEHGSPRAWFAFDGDDLLAKTGLTLARQSWTIWDCTSVRELLGGPAGVPDEPGADVSELPSALLALGREHGWDTPLYRADDVLGEGRLETLPVSVVTACTRALSTRGPVRVYPDDSAAMAAFERGDAEFGAAGWKARWALRQQLIELEVLADDT